MYFRKRISITVVITILVTVGVLCVLLLNSKSVELNKQDRIYIRQFLRDWHIDQTPQRVHRSFETEFNFISIIQDSVLANITGEQIPHVYFGNVYYYYKNRQGICYDRAVLIEKILLLYHFQFRHVYLYFGKQRDPAKSDFFKAHVNSHAALEVRTQKGWMAIGTDANWLGLGRQQQLLNYFDFRKDLNETGGTPRLAKPPTNGTCFWKQVSYHFRIIYGIYSRHGDFFTGASENESKSLFTGRRHFLPDYNFRMLLYNF